MIELPDDDNGRVLKRLHDGGDSLTKPRIVEYQFIFEERAQSLEFAGVIPENEFEVCLSYYEERAMWQAEVKIYMVPSHDEITRIEGDLSDRAAPFGGKADGWCCIRIKDNLPEEA